MRVYILSHGWRNNSVGYPVGAFKTKRSVREYVRSKFPQMKGTHRLNPNEMYWQSEGEWMKCDDQTIKVFG